MSWVKKHLPKKRWKRGVLYVLSTFLILLAADMILVQYWRRIEIGPETTRITAPLTADGYPDYIAALNAELSAGVTSENNAAPLLMQLVAANSPAGGFDDVDAYENWRKHLCAALGVPDVPASPLATYRRWLAARDPKATEGDLDNRTADLAAMSLAPWRAADHPEWKQWIDDNQDALETLHLAAKRDHYYLPLIGPNGKTTGNHPGGVMAMLLPLLGNDRQAANLLLAHAMLRLGEGDTAAFIDDVTAALKLSRFASRSSTLVERLVAVAIESTVHQTIQRAVVGDLLNRAAAEKLAAALNAMPPMPPLAHTFDTGERYSFLDSVCLISRAGPAGVREYWIDTASEPEQNFFSSTLPKYLIPIHCNAVLRTGNKFYDRFIAAMAEPTYARQQAAFDAIDHEIIAFRSQNPFKQFGDPGMLLVSIVLPSVTHINQNCLVGSVSSDLSGVALQLRIYKINHGEFPTTIAALGLPASATTDRFCDAPFIYRRTPAGYLLYSVGPDGKDDGGITRKEARGSPGWDIVVKAESAATSQKPQ